MRSTADLIADEFTLRTIDLNRFEASVRRQVLRILEELERELRADLERVDPAAPVRTAFKRRRLKALEEQARRTIATAYKNAAKAVDDATLAVAETEAIFARKAFDRAIGVDLLSVAIPEATLRALASELLVPMSATQSQPLSVWWAAQKAATRRRFMGEMRSGILRGETTSELVQRVRGVPLRDDEGKIRYGKAAPGERAQILRAPGVLDTSRREAATLVRTAVQGVANDARMATFEANPDVVRGVAAVTTFDLRTSDICIARTGAAWDMEGKPLPESTRKEPFPGAPPWHPNCRSTLSAVLRSFSEIMRKAKARKRAEVRDLSPSTRASMDGMVPATQTFEQFLGKRTEAQQRKMLGAGKWRLWKDGELSLSELIDETGRPISLTQLRARAEAA